MIASTAVQQMLFNVDVFLEEKSVNGEKKRIHFEVPTYKKAYSIYQYDREKYMAIWEKVRSLALKLDNPLIFKRVNPYRVLRLCYLRDNDRQLVYLGDEKGIFRTKALQNIYTLLYNYSGISPLISDDMVEVDGLICYPEDRAAEINNTWQLPIIQRLKMHLKLLRLIQSGETIKNAVKKVCNARF